MNPPLTSPADRRRTPAGYEGGDAAVWRPLYRLAGGAALVCATMTVLGVVTFLVWPPPEGTVTEWFDLFQRNAFVGLLSLDLALLLSFVASIPLVLALYLALRRAGAAAMLLSTALALVSAATYTASSRAFELLALSEQYAVATTAAERAALEAAGQAMLTVYLGAVAGPTPVPGWTYQGTAFNVSFVLWCVAGAVMSGVALRSGLLGRGTGLVGLVGNALALGLFAPGVGVYLSLASLPLLLAWFVLLARGLFRLGKEP